MKPHVLKRKCHLTSEKCIPCF